MKKLRLKMDGSTLYLLGEDENGSSYWLQVRKWNFADWRSFAQVLVFDVQGVNFTNNFLGASDMHEFPKFLVRNNGEYDKQTLVRLVCTEEEKNELVELSKTFYALKGAAHLFYYGWVHTSLKNVIPIMDRGMANHLIDKVIPEIIKRVTEILTPDEEKTDDNPDAG